MTVKIKRGQAAGLINLTPMIDVVFQLLLFFLVASKFADEERRMKILLPDASAARPITAKADAYFVNVDREGRLFVGGRQMSRASLEGSLRQAAADDPRRTVIIRADKRVPFEHVVVVMDACNKANLRNYYTTTAEPSRSQPASRQLP